MWENSGINIVVALVSGLLGFYFGNRRDEKQFERQINDESRQRWNRDILVIKDFLSKANFQAVNSVNSSDPDIKKKIGGNLMPGFPMRELWRLSETYRVLLKKQGDPKEDTHMVVLNNLSHIHTYLISWNPGFAPAGEFYPDDIDIHGFIELVGDTNELLELK